MEEQTIIITGANCGTGLYHDSSHEGELQRHHLGKVKAKSSMKRANLLVLIDLQTQWEEIHPGLILIFDVAGTITWQELRI